MVERNIKLRYRRSILGYMWTLLIPLSTAAIYYFLFKVILQVKIPDFALFVTIGILLWTYFSGTLLEGMDSLVTNINIMLQVNIPLNVFPLTTALSNLITLALALPVIFGAAYFSDVGLGWSAIVFFYYLFLLFIQTYCLAYILSIAVIYIRDLRQALGILLQLWMYGTPILYQMNFIPEQYIWILFVNPVGKIFTGIHNCLLRGLWPTPAELAIPLAWTFLIFIATFIVHLKASKLAIERI